MPKPSSTAITTDATADTLSNATLLDQIMACLLYTSDAADE